MVLPYTTLPRSMYKITRWIIDLWVWERVGIIIIIHNLLFSAGAILYVAKTKVFNAPINVLPH